VLLRRYDEPFLVEQAPACENADDGSQGRKQRLVMVTDKVQRVQMLPIMFSSQVVMLMTQLAALPLHRCADRTRGAHARRAC